MRLERGSTAMWFTGCSLTILLLVVGGVLALLLRAGMAPFWPATIVEVHARDGDAEQTWLGAVADESDDGLILRLSDDQAVGPRYHRIDRAAIVERTMPVDAAMIRSGDDRLRYLSGEEVRHARLTDDDTVSHPNAWNGFERTAAMFGGFVRFVATGPERGGVLPALIGTVTLVLLMSVLVMPIGVAAAIWLSEYAGRRRRAHWVRAALTSLAGVPTIVYGVLGLGLFVHAIGGSVDHLFFAERLPAPTFGSGGLLWAALTLALLTVPVVVVSIEQGLARIPRGLRDGSLALGATRGETLWNLLLPMARPALLTALILAIARAAGAVAPLMLVGVVKWAPSLPIDGEFPYLHPSRQFMHLGFSIYDQAFASADAYAGTGRAWTCALLLVLVVVLLNSAAILLRRRLVRQQHVLEQDSPE